MLPGQQFKICQLRPTTLGNIKVWCLSPVRWWFPLKCTSYLDMMLPSVFGVRTLKFVIYSSRQTCLACDGIRKLQNFKTHLSKNMNVRGREKGEEERNGQCSGLKCSHSLCIHRILKLLLTQGVGNILGFQGRQLFQRWQQRGWL